MAGFIFLGFGLVSFVLGLFVGITDSSVYTVENPGSADAMVRATLLRSMLPYVATAALCWVVAVVGVVGGAKKPKV